MAARFRPYYHLLAALAIACLLGFSSCQKEVHLNLASSPPQLVVEGAVETGLPPYVFLTTTISYFAKVDLTTLQNSYVHGANVTVSDGSQTITLREYSLDTAAGAKIYFYTIDTASLSNVMLGKVGSFYKLTINWNGSTYTSTTKIPAVKGLDTLWFADPLFRNSRTPDSAKELYGNYSDPDTPGNYVRYYTKRNSEPFYAGQLFSDEVVNGKKIGDLALPAGFLQTENAKPDSLLYFYPGDTVVLKWCEIDKGVYDFWNTWQFANNAIGNPFASPINIQTNISGGALGIWAGYGSVYDTLIMK
jgi:hypothetical protein